MYLYMYIYVYTHIPIHTYDIKENYIKKMKWQVTA